MPPLPTPFDQQRAALHAGTLHLWRLSLLGDTARVEQARARLSVQEQARAARLHLERDRRRWLLARAGLRTLLGHYLGEEAARLPFEVGPQGKPALPGTALRFNLSHSHELALVALAWGRELGVDVEWLGRTTDVRLVAGRFFSPAEQQALFALPEGAWPAAFLRLWTRKEAILKGTGLGLTLPLDSFDVSLGEPTRLLAVRGQPWQPADWALHHLDPAPGYVGALAVAGGAPPDVHSWTL